MGSVYAFSLLPRGVHPKAQLLTDLERLQQVKLRLQQDAESASFTFRCDKNCKSLSGKCVRCAACVVLCLRVGGCVAMVG